MITVIVDAENVRRSQWPNLTAERLIDLVRAWGEEAEKRSVIVFDGSAPVDDADVIGTGAESADDWIAREAKAFAPYWLVTSDRELRRRAGADAERIIGGGAFARDIQR